MKVSNIKDNKKAGPKNIWIDLKKKADAEHRPICVLAPMADVTDAAFRKVIAKYGMPDAMWTEFVSADGLARATGIGKEKLLRHLLYSKNEKPIIAQFFTSTPEYMKAAAELAYKLGFDGIDINMGCPDRSVEKQCAGAALMKDPKNARALIRAAKEGAHGLPVSVKTRLGFNKDELETWLPELLAENPAVITVHARTRKELSLVPARWERVKRAVEIRNELKSDTLIFGNGDVLSVEHAHKLAKESGADGVMLGRAIFGNPWLFGTPATSVEEKLKVMLEHTKLFEKLLGDVKNFAVMRKHYKAYVSGFEGASALRVKLMETQNAKEVAKVVKDYLAGNVV